MLFLCKNALGKCLRNGLLLDHIHITNSTKAKPCLWWWQLMFWLETGKDVADPIWGLIVGPIFLFPDKMMVMDGLESSLECFGVSWDGAFTIKECSSPPHSKINTKSSLGFHIRWLLAAYFRLPVSPLCKYGCVVFWVMSPSKNRVRFLISLQNSLLH